LNAETLRQRLFSKAEDLPAGTTRLPIKTVHLNRSPIVVSNLRTLQPETAARWGLDVEQALRHAETAARQVPALAGIWPAVFERPPRAAPVDVDEDLYGGFIGNEDRRSLERLRSLSPEDLAGHHPAFHDARLDELLFRYRARNHPQTLNEAEREQWREHCARRLHEGSAGALTLAGLLERIDRLGETADERGQEILGALVDYATDIAPDRR
jgi:exodeoxyribonuclease-1